MKKFKVVYDLVKETFPDKTDEAIFSIIYEIDQKAFVEFGHPITEATWIKTASSVAPKEPGPL